MLLNNVELRDSTRGRGAGGAAADAGEAGRRGESGGPPAAPPRPVHCFAGPASAPPVPPAPPSAPPPRRAVGLLARRDVKVAAKPRIGRLRRPNPSPGGLVRSGGDDERITIDMRPIRREILRQYASQEEFMKLPEASGSGSSAR